MAPNYLRELQGRKVKVFSGQSGFTDEGVLEYCDGVFIKLRKGDEEFLYFPLVSVRLVKPLPDTI